jgi:hypothetical protein
MQGAAELRVLRKATEAMAQGTFWSQANRVLLDQMLPRL